MNEAYPDFDVRSYIDLDWIARLISFLPQARAWWINPLNETTDFGVDPTTIRAIGTGSKKADPTWGPLAAYNSWAKDRVAELGLSMGSCPAAEVPGWAQLDIESSDGFDAWHTHLANSLQEHWHDWLGKVQAASEHPILGWPERARTSTADGYLLVAHKYKLVDLFIRFLRVLAPAGSSLERGIVCNANIPLDMKSIAVINATFGGLSVAGGASMGNIKSELSYRTYQRLARAICFIAGDQFQRQNPESQGCAGVSPVLFDVFVWQSSDAKALYTDGKKNPEKGPGGRMPRRKPTWWQMSVGTT